MVDLLKETCLPRLLLCSYVIKKKALKISFFQNQKALGQSFGRYH